MPPAAPPPVTLVVGDEELLVSRAVEGVVAAVRGASQDAEVHRLAGARLEAGDLREVLSPSLFGGPTVVVVDGVGEATDAADELLAAVTAPAPDTTLVLLHAGGVKGKKLVDAVREVARVVECPRVTRPDERVAFVQAEFRRAGRPVDDEAAGVLVEAVGGDLRTLAAAVDQLVQDTEGPVDVEAVVRYHRSHQQPGGFEVADLAVVGDRAAALALVRWGLSVGFSVGRTTMKPGEGFPVITSALATAVRSVAQVAAAGARDEGDLARVLGMPPWKVRRVRQQARGWRPEGIEAALRAVAEADAGVKGGAVDAAYVLEKAVLAVADARDLR